LVHFVKAVLEQTGLCCSISDQAMCNLCMEYTSFVNNCYSTLPPSFSQYFYAQRVNINIMLQQSI